MRPGLARGLPVIALAWMACACPVHGQDNAPPALRQQPALAIQAFEPAADAPYELGRGDEIDVEVIGRPELTGKHTIGPDGFITLPLTGPLKVADQTREGAAAIIQTALSTYYSGISVSIGVERYASNKILLMGAVEKPGIQLFDTVPTLLEVISRGGAQLQTTASSNSGGGLGMTSPSIRPGSVPENVMIYRGNQTMITVELRHLLDEGSPLANMRLKRDDVVYVPGQNKFVSVLGFVSRPGNLRLDNSSTLSELLAEAGGPLELAGRNPRIKIIHKGINGAPGHMQEIAYKDLLKPMATDLKLQSGDIILVPESGFNGAGYTFSKLAPLVQLFTVGSLLQ